MEDKDRIRRWRLILGEESQKQFEDMGGFEKKLLSQEQVLMDQALAAIYNRERSFSGGQGAGKAH